MPVDLRQLLSEIKANGYGVTQTKQGHYWVVDSTGAKLVPFAVTHGSKTKRNQVKDNYVRAVRKAIQ